MAKNVLFRPWKQLKVLQNKRLHHFITRQLYPFNPHYRKLFDKNKINPQDIKCVEDLQRIPFTSKKDFFNSSNKDPIKRNLNFVLQPDTESIRKYSSKAKNIELLILSLLKGKEYIKKKMANEYRPTFLTLTAGTTNQPVSFLYTSYDIKNLH